MIASLFLALAFYGLAFDPAITNVPTSSRIFPVDGLHYRMVQPDGKIRHLRKDPERPGVLIGDYPWVGVVKGNVISVWADPSATSGRRRTAFTFANGALRSLWLDGQTYEFAKGLAQLESPLISLWPEKRSRSYEKGSGADIWRRGQRLRLWFANPNSAGLLCVQVALLGLYLLLFMRGAYRIHGMLILLISLILTGMSGSRGAFLGFCTGALLLGAAFVRRRCSIKSIAAALGVVGLAVGAIALAGKSGRFTDSFGHVDTGNQRRLTIAKAAVQMFADAPWGWTGGEVPGRNAALNFYVDKENHVIRTHLLSMAELGWCGGFAYVCFWALMLSYGIFGMRRGDSLCASEWTAFALAGLFNPVYTETSLWALPIAVTGLSAWRLRKAVSYRLIVICAMISALVSLLIVIALIGAGTALNEKRRTSVRAEGKQTVLNGAEPAVWIVEDKSVLGGGSFPGREIRVFYAKNPKAQALGYVWDIHDLPRTVEKLVLPGRAAADYLAAYAKDPQNVCHAKTTMFLSPAAGPDQVPESLCSLSRVVWIAGNLVAQRASKVYQHKRQWVHIVPGIEKYVPNWLRLVLSR